MVDDQQTLLNSSKTISDLNQAGVQLSKIHQQQSKQNINDLSMIERFLNSEQHYGDVLRLLECAYAESGDYLADYTLVEYVMSQNGLSYNTFRQSVLEKFNEVEWSEELLRNLYLVVNKNQNNHRGMSSNGKNYF